MDDLEVVEFNKPTENSKSLYLTNLPVNIEEVVIHERLTSIFSKYGLLYEVLLKQSFFDGQKPNETSENVPQEGAAKQCDEHSSIGQSVCDFSYAFVTYCTASSACRAKKDLTGRLFIKGKHIKIQFARRKQPENPVPLYISRCYELANHMLGFNGWNARIHKLSIKENDTESPDVKKVTAYALVMLELINHGQLVANGYGTNTQTYHKNGNEHGIAICKAKKIAKEQAVVDAFQQVVLVVLPDGRVHAEVNTTIEDCLEKEGLLETGGEIKVNQVEYDIGSDSEDNTDLDLANQQLLEDLLNEDME